ncbi:MAG: glutathione S-transferase family protein [Pseudomonadota bacterium]
MITLHHLEYSQSFRILWLLEELDADYELKLYERDPQTLLAPAAYKALSPTGAAPVIADDDLVLAESSAIVDYILDQYPEGTLRPPVGHPDRTRYLFWLHAAQGSMMPILLMDSVFRIIEARVPFIIRALIRTVLRRATDGFCRPRLDLLLEKAEHDLASAPWFGGAELTAADIVLCYPMEGARQRGYLTAAHPHCHAWLERLEAQPGFMRAKARDGRPGIVLPL